MENNAPPPSAPLDSDSSALETQLTNATAAFLPEAESPSLKMPSPIDKIAEAKTDVAEVIPSTSTPAEKTSAAPPAKSKRAIKREAKVLARYAEVRRQQYELFNKLLETLTRVDDLPENYLQQIRDAIFHTDHPFLLTLVGPFSSGKSSVINALLGESVLQIGPVPTTDHIAILRYGPTLQKSRTGEVSTVFYPADLLQNLSLVDTPGLESVFKRHDELTLSFLHRADIVVLVMLAMQVLTAGDLAFMQSLKDYGKRLIIVVNQIDILEPPDREKVADFVREQSMLHLGLEPLVWLVSAKEALKAYSETPRDEIIWDESGFADIEEYLYETLDDTERVRQKLETPLQIARKATQAALQHLQTSQSALDVHRKTVENIEVQINAAQRERERLLEKSVAELEREWQEAAKKGARAIGELFQPSRALGQSIAGFFEIVGLGAFMRRFRKKTKAQEAFMRHEVRETLQRIPSIADKIGPEIEGRDQEDIDRLVEYTRGQIQNLPPTLSNKIIGKVQTPMTYERKSLRAIRGDLEDLVNKAGNFETSRIDRALRGTIMTMGMWMVIVVILGVLIATGGILGGGSGILNLVIILGLALVGLAMLPVRGWLLQRDYTHRLGEIESRYKEILGRSAREQIGYGTQLRRDVTAPFTRLIQTQIELTDQLKRELQSHEQGIVGLQHSLSALLKD